MGDYPNIKYSRYTILPQWGVFDMRGMLGGLILWARDYSPRPVLAVACRTSHEFLMTLSTRSGSEAGVLELRMAGARPCGHRVNRQSCYLKN